MFDHLFAVELERRGEGKEGEEGGGRWRGGGEKKREGWKRERRKWQKRIG